MSPLRGCTLFLARGCESRKGVDAAGVGLILALEETIVSKDSAIIGVSDHGGWAVLVTVAGDGTLLDRRRIELVDEGLPKIPHHSEGQALPVEEAVALVERVEASAIRHSKLVLEAVAATV